MLLGDRFLHVLSDHTFGNTINRFFLRDTFQTTQGNRLSCRDQEGRRGSEEAVPGPSVFPSGDPGVSGDFWDPVACRMPGFRVHHQLQGLAMDRGAW